jgi:hypothetical protein
MFLEGLARDIQRACGIVFLLPFFANWLVINPIFAHYCPELRPVLVTEHLSSQCKLVLFLCQNLNSTSLLLFFNRLMIKCQQTLVSFSLSKAKKSRISPKSKSQALPSETIVEKPIFLSNAQSRTAAIMAPD